MSDPGSAAVDHGRLAMRLMPAVLAAGRQLLAHRASGVVAERKADGSPVTDADREAELIVLGALAAAAPAVPVIAEEAVSAGRIPAHADRAFLVDALDGTREFVTGGDDFTVNVALVQAGVPVFGIVLAPALGRLFATIGPDRAVAARVTAADLASACVPELSDIRTAAPDPDALRILTSRSHLSRETEDFVRRYPGASVRGMGSSVKFGMIAAGEADLYPRFGPTSAWDTAAGHAVLLAAGGAVTTADGRPLTYLSERGSYLNPSFIAWGRPGLVRAA